MAGEGVHPSAIVEDGATIAADARIGPFCVVGGGARIDAGAELKSHVFIEGRVSIGERTVIYPFTTLGCPPQHVKSFKDDTEVVIGADVIVREQVSIHRGTVLDKGRTVIADRAFVMAAAHIGHDCVIAEGATIGGHSALGGHCEIGEGAFLGGAVALHQFVRIGAFAYIGGGSAVDRDVVPYASAFGNRAKVRGPNLVGLKRLGASKESTRAVRAAYAALFNDEGGVFADRVARVAETHGDSPEVRRILDFIEAGGSRSILGV